MPGESNVECQGPTCDIHGNNPEQGMRAPEPSDLIGGETDAFPTPWKVRDGFAREEWRQVDLDIYEVRNPEDVMIMPKAGWDKYNEGAIAFLEWLNENKVKMISRADG